MAKEMRSTQKVSCQEAIHLVDSLSQDRRGWCAIHCRYDWPVMFGNCVSSGFSQLMCLLICANKKTEILPHSFAYLHWKSKAGKGHRIIYMYSPHTAFSVHSWCFPVPHRSSMAFVGILVVSQKSSASFLNLLMISSDSLSDRVGLGFSVLELELRS